MQQHPDEAFDNRLQRKRWNLSRWAIQHAALTRYLLVALLVLGVAAYFQLGQDEDPPFTFRAMVVQAHWPGATAQQIAEQVTDKIERALQEVPHTDKIRSYTKSGESLTILQIKDASPPKEVPKVWYEARKKISDMRASLPTGVIGPFFNDEFGDVYGSMYALSADGFSLEESRREAEKIRSMLLKAPDVAKVDLFGAQEEKIFVEISSRRLAQLGIDFSQVLQQLGAQNAIEGAGVLNTEGSNLQIRVGGQFKSIQDLETFSIHAVNATTGAASNLRLGDIALIRRGYIDPPQSSVHHQGQQVIAIGVSMVKGGDVIQLGKNLTRIVDALRAELPLGLDLQQIQDQPRAVADSVSEFMHALLEAITIVLVVSVLSLGLHTRPLRLDIRPGMIVAITIPLVLSITFILMKFWGIGLHKISLGALIIALGLLVDDAIIAVEMMVRKLEQGHDKVSAATAAYRLTAMPMLTGTLITAAGFLPIGLAQSTVGEYTFAIFAVTSIALLVSWVVSVYFVPYLGVVFLNSSLGVKKQASHERFDTPFYRRFRACVASCMRHRWLTIGLTVLVFLGGVFGMGLVQKQFFADSSRLELLVDLWLPEGTSYEANEAAALRFESRLKADPTVRAVTTWIGSGVPRFYLPLDQIFPQTNVSQMIVLPQNRAARETLRQQIPHWLAQEFPEIRGRVKLLPNGPPIPYPVQFRVIGPDPKVLRMWADQAKETMRAHPDMTGVNDNWNESVKALSLSIDQDKARALGVTSQDIAQTTKTVLSGSMIGQYREGDRLLDIVLRQPLQERKAVSDLAHAYVPAASGRAIPLTQLAQIKLGWEPGVLWRENRNYAIAVQGDVREGVQGQTVSQSLWPKMQTLAQKMPQGYTIDIAGAEEESRKGEASIAVGLPVMLFIILTLLILQLQSVSRAVLVFLTGPMGLPGVAGALLIFGQPFGFVAMLGVIALMGMIMRNAVILIDQIEQNRTAGMSPQDAIIDSAAARFRPIVLTAAAAVLAMIPLSHSLFWGPMAIAIMGGLIVATALTLLALPALYAAWFRVSVPKKLN